MGESIKLNFGCSKWKLPGFINIDKDPSVKPDLLKEITLPLDWEDNSVDEIYCGHFIEHLFIDDAIEMIKECYRVLKPGGNVIFVVPDFQKIFNEFDFVRANKMIMSNDGKDIEKVGQPIDPHKSLWTKYRLETEMLNAGFRTEVLGEYKYLVANVSWQTIILGRK